MEKAECVFEMESFMWQWMRDQSKPMMNAVTTVCTQKVGSQSWHGHMRAIREGRERLTVRETECV